MKPVPSLVAVLTLLLTPGVTTPPGPPDGTAQDVPPGDRAAAGLRVGADRLAAGLDVAVSDSVGGDLMVAGGGVSVRAPVRGDLLAAGARVRVRGPVGGSVRAAGGEVVLAGEVGRNVTLTGGSVRVDSGGAVRGNAYVAAGEVAVEGEVAGHLRASAGIVRILGRVGGPVEVTADRVVVGPGARLEQGLDYRSPEPAEVAEGARIDGTVTHRPAEGRGLLATWVGHLTRMAAFLLTGGVLVALFPGAFDRLRSGLATRPGPALGLGLAGLVVLPLALVLAGVTVVGIPIMVIGGGLLASALYVSRAVVALWLGDRLLGRGPARAREVAAFVVGGAILFLAGLLPWVGWAVTVLATLAGFGAAVEVVTRRWRQSGTARTRT